MERFRLEKSVFGGTNVYDEAGRQVGYSLPSVFGDGEDFYDMSGRPVGQTFDSALGAEYFTGPEASGYLDREFLMGRNAYLDGDPFSKKEDPGTSGFGGGPGPDGFDVGDGFGPGDGPGSGFDPGNGFDSGPEW